MNNHILFFKKLIAGVDRSMMQAKGKRDEAEQIANLMVKREHYTAAIAALLEVDHEKR